MVVKRGSWLYVVIGPVLRPFIPPYGGINPCVHARERERERASKRERYIKVCVMI